MLPPGKLRQSLRPSLFSAVFILIALSVTTLIDDALLIMPVGASTFLAFSFPLADSTKPRCLFGGYGCGAFWGLLASLGRQWIQGGTVPVSAAEAAATAGAAATVAGIFTVQQGAAVLACVFAMLFAALSMNLLDTEHAPSAALALSITLSDRPLAMAVVAFINIGLLSFCKERMVKAGFIGK